MLESIKGQLQGIAPDRLIVPTILPIPHLSGSTRTPLEFAARNNTKRIGAQVSGKP